MDNLSDEEIMLLNLPTGIPFVYELDENMKPIKSMQFLGDEETVKKAIESVASQGKAKPEVAPAAPPPEVKPHQTGWSWTGLPPGSGPTGTVQKEGKDQFFQLFGHL